MKTVLVVDDKSSVRMLLQDYLGKEGFKVVTAVNGQEAIYAARHALPDVILLDIMMPEKDGFAFLKEYRQERNTPVIIITAREEETDAVLGLELGADDYIIKPFRMRELVSRIRAVLRRSESGLPTVRVLRAGDLVVDESSHTVKLAEREIYLTPMEFNLLALLMASAGRVLTREQIVDNLSASGFAGLERTLNVHVRNLRAKIEQDPENPHFIETVFGVGYRFRDEI
ncbi:MAG: response regulator transcription factor [Anaerolineae bacterium]|nr:response regulator transcription factor [Anaerolineae bacterium]